MALLREKEMILRVPESEKLLLPTDSYWKQLEQSERSKRSSIYQYISPESRNTKISNSVSQNSRSSDLHGLLLTLTITDTGIWIMTLKQMLLRLPIAPA